MLPGRSRLLAGLLVVLVAGLGVTGATVAQPRHEPAVSAARSSSPAAQYADSGGRFVEAGYRCGTEGVAGGLDSALVDCSNGKSEFLYSVG